MELNRRKFLSRALVVGGASLATYSLSKADIIQREQPIETVLKDSLTGAGYTDTEHNRRYYRTAAF